MQRLTFPPSSAVGQLTLVARAWVCPACFWGIRRGERASIAAAPTAGKDYEARLRQQHNKLNPRTGWASLKKARRKGAAAAAEGGGEEGEEEGGAEALLSRAGGLLAKGDALPPGLLETTRLKDANQVRHLGCVGAGLLWAAAAGR